MKYLFFIIALFPSAARAQYYPLPTKPSNYDYFKAWYFDDLFTEVQAMNERLAAREQDASQSLHLTKEANYIPFATLHSLIYGDPQKVKAVLAKWGWLFSKGDEQQTVFYYPESGLSDYRKATSTVMLAEKDTVVRGKPYHILSGGGYSSASSDVAAAYVLDIEAAGYRKIDAQSGDELSMAVYGNDMDIVVFMRTKSNGRVLYMWNITR